MYNEDEWTMNFNSHRITGEVSIQLYIAVLFQIGSIFSISNETRTTTGSKIYDFQFLHDINVSIK